MNAGWAGAERRLVVVVVGRRRQRLDRRAGLPPGAGRGLGGGCEVAGHVDVGHHDPQCDEDGPAGTAYSDVWQLFMSSHSGVSGRIPPAAAGDHRTLRRKYTVCGSALWFMMWKMPLQLPLSA